MKTPLHLTLVGPLLLPLLMGGCQLKECRYPIETAQHVRWAQTCTTMEQLEIRVGPGVTDIELPALEQVESVIVRGGQDLQRLSFPSLHTVDLHVVIDDTRVLQTLSMPVLDSMESLQVAAPSIDTLELGALRRVSESLVLHQGPIDLVLPSLEHVGRLELGGVAGMRSVELPALTSAESLVLGGSLRRAELAVLEDPAADLLAGPWFEELRVPNMTGIPHYVFASENNTGTLTVDTGPNARPELCFGSSSSFTTLEILGSTTLQELSLWQLTELEHVDAPQVSRILLLDYNRLDSLPSDELDGLLEISDEADQLGFLSSCIR